MFSGKKAISIASEITTKLANNDKVGLLEQVHNLAVNASTLGATKLFDYCKQLEAMLGDPEKPVTRQMFSDLQLEVDKLLVTFDEISDLISAAGDNVVIQDYSSVWTVPDKNLPLAGARIQDSMTYIDLLSALQSLGEPVLLKGMLQRLLAASRDVLSHLPRFQENNDFYAAEQRLHALKGVSGNIRVIPIFEITSRLYSIIQSRQWPASADLQELDDLIKYLDDCWDDIADSLHKMQSKPAQIIRDDSEYGKFLP